MPTNNNNNNRKSLLAMAHLLFSYHHRVHKHLFQSLSIYTSMYTFTSILALFQRTKFKEFTVIHLANVFTMLWLHKHLLIYFIILCYLMELNVNVSSVCIIKSNILILLTAYTAKCVEKKRRKEEKIRNMTRGAENIQTIIKWFFFLDEIVLVLAPHTIKTQWRDLKPCH